MITRRETLWSLAGFFLVTPHTNAFAQDALEVPPQEAGLADFAGAWERTDGGEVQAAISPEIPPELGSAYAQIYFNRYDGPFTFLANHTGMQFETWYNASIDFRRNSELAPIHDISSRGRLAAFWEGYLGLRSVSLLEFLTYFSVFVGETGGTFRKAAEAYNRDDRRFEHPGIAYLFNSFMPQGRPWRKKSYNQLSNLTCFEAFNDDDFNKAFQHLPGGSELKNTTEPAWRGQIFPKDRFSTSGDPRVNGYIIESDFFKFRGRGLIQTTWRENYKALVKFIQDYTGDDDLVKSYQERWEKGRFTADQVCTISSNADWDRLFNETNDIPCAAVLSHSEMYDYLPLSFDSDVLNSDQKGSILYFGNRLGGRGYGHRLRSRVHALCTALGRV